MPSGHAMTVAFLAYVIIMKNATNPMIGNLAGALVIIAVSYSRVKKQCHTVLQVVIGSLLGILCGHLFTQSFKI
jgi:membrane-associated phospholipid phosphatase